MNRCAFNAGITVFLGILLVVVLFILIGQAAPMERQSVANPPAIREPTRPASDVTRWTPSVIRDRPATAKAVNDNGSAVSFVATSITLYGYDVPQAWLRVIGTQDNTYVRVINLETGTVISETTDLDRYGTWDVYPSDGTFYKVEADKPVVGYETNLDSHSTFVPSLDSGPVGREFIFYYNRDDFEPNVWYVFAMEDADVKVYDTAGIMIVSQDLLSGDYWELDLSNGVYHIISSGSIAIESVINDAYSTVPSVNGYGAGQQFYFATYHLDWHPGALAVFAYQDADVAVYDLDSDALVYTQHIDQGDYWWETGVITRRVRLDSTGMVEVWAGSTQGGTSIEYLGDDLSFAGGVGGREYYIHSLMDGSVIFAPFDNTQVDVDGATYYLNKDEYLHLEGCCYFRHIQSSQPVLIQTLGRDGWWDNLGTYLGGVSLANLAVVKQPTPNPVQAGEPLTYTLRVTNTGGVDLHAIITDLLPAQVVPGGKLVWTPTITAPGGVWAETVVVTVTLGYSGTLTNVVQVATDEGLTGVYTSTVTSQVTPMLEVTKSAFPDPVVAGDRLTYTIRITNTGNITLHATVTDVLPDHVTRGGVLIWTPTLNAAGGAWTQKVVVTAEEDYSGTLTNLVQVTTLEGATGSFYETCAAIIEEFSLYLPLVLRNTP